MFGYIFSQKVLLTVRSRDERPVLINAREVMADCVSPDADTLLGFKVCGRKVVTAHAPGGRQQVQIRFA